MRQVLKLLGIYISQFWSDWFARMSGPLSVPAAIAAPFFEGWQRAGLIATAMICLFASSFIVWKKQSARAEALEEKLRPKIKVLQVSEFSDIAPNLQINSQTGEFTNPRIDQVFELEIMNISGQELTNCLAKVDDLTIFTQVMRGSAMAELDNSTPYKPHLPLALRTARNFDRDGAGPFHLRAGEKKKIRICSRTLGALEPIKFPFEPDAPDHLRTVTLAVRGNIKIELFGPPTSTVEELTFQIENGRLMVRRDSAA